eukprot:6028669-Pleurochrysis_carterae.AAC.1
MALTGGVSAVMFARGETEHPLMRALALASAHRYALFPPACLPVRLLSCFFPPCLPAYASATPASSF